MDFEQIQQETGGTRITVQNDKLTVPNTPIIPFIEGDGIGPDIWRASKQVLDSAVEKAYGGSKRIAWTEILAGEKAHKKTGEWLPTETLDAIKHFMVAIKGPLTTPVGGGIPKPQCNPKAEARSVRLCPPCQVFQRNTVSGV